MAHKPSKNGFQQANSEVKDTAIRHKLIGDYISYGLITDVNDQYQVKVALLEEDGKVQDQNIMGDTFLPLINTIDDVYMRFGSLRQGQTVRLHWRGHPSNNVQASDISWCVIEVIADLNHSFVSKPVKENSIPQYPYKIFSGGIFG